MTRATWTTEAAERFALTPDRAPAYRAPDKEFALYNDYRAGAAVLVPHPGRAEPEEVFALWQGPSGTSGPRRLGPHEPVEGYGTFTFPYGPVSMGVPEAGRFDVTTYGERILEIVPVGGFKSRRILERISGQGVADAALGIERAAGNFAAAHVSAFLAAAESAAGTPVRSVECWTRALAQELQRIYNHLHVIARIAEAASQNVGLAQMHALAEGILRLQGALFGHRWLFGALLPGGPRRHLDAEDRRWLSQRLTRVGKEFTALRTLFLESRTFIDRLQGTCRVPREAAVAWGAVGPALRATGVRWDDRLRAPTPPYSDLFVALPEERDGDALARVLVRAEEVGASLLLLEQLLDRWPANSDAEEPPAPPVRPGRGLGRAEGPSGDLVYDVEIADGRVVRAWARTPSDANWPLFAVGMRNSVFTDLHFALESFGLVYADTDR